MAVSSPAYGALASTCCLPGNAEWQPPCVQWDTADPCHFLEIVEYADEVTWAADQGRVDNDPEMGAWLTRWRALLDGPLAVRTFTEAESWLPPWPRSA